MTGAFLLKGNKCQFRVWAPEKENMKLHIVHPVDKLVDMQKDKQGYFSVTINDIKAGSRYFFQPENGKDLPDVASQFQPEGVFGPSEVVDHQSFQWNDSAWKGLPIKEMIMYEIHVGTFTEEGTFEAIIPLLDDLLETGINTIELMPVAQFPGTRNWGYDGVFPYATQHSYGGPEGLKKLVDACHSKGIAVFLDVVYNHIGPEGNHFNEFAPYFTDHYHTPWGDAVNFDGAYSDGVRNYFSDNAIYWLEQFHFDGLRLDAIHSIFDNGAVHFWDFVNNKVNGLEMKLGRHLYLVAESDLNDPKVIRSPETGGYGFDAQWLDDFHHAAYVQIDENGKDRYKDFRRLDQLAKAFTDGFVHSGEYVEFRKRKHGSSSAGISGKKFVVFNQNHDQVGNREKGERLSMLVNAERLKLAAGTLLLSPYIPLLFMGEEYGEDQPFFYFVNHSDPELVNAVREGRKKEFKDFNWEADPPDPQAEKTFTDSKLQWKKRNKGKHGIIHAWYKTLIQMRKQPALQTFKKNNIRAYVLENKGLVLHRRSEDESQYILCFLNFSSGAISYTLPGSPESWKTLLDSNDAQWQTKDHKKFDPHSISEKGKLVIPPLSVIVMEAIDQIM